MAIIMDRLTAGVRKIVPWTMIFADDVVLCSDSRDEVEEELERWKHATKASKIKTGYLCLNEKEESEGCLSMKGSNIIKKKFLM